MEKIADGLSSLTWPRNLYVGSNQDIDFRSAVDFLSHFKVREIEKDEADVLKRLLFNGDSLGAFPWSLLERLME